MMALEWEEQGSFEDSPERSLAELEEAPRLEEPRGGGSSGDGEEGSYVPRSY